MPPAPCSVTTTSPLARPSSRVRNADVSALPELTTGNRVMFSYVMPGSSRHEFSVAELGSGAGAFPDIVGATAPSVSPLTAVRLIKLRNIEDRKLRLSMRASNARGTALGLRTADRENLARRSLPEGGAEKCGQGCRRYRCLCYCVA